MSASSNSEQMEAYFDESGTDAASPVMCIAGYLFKAEQARHLEREWAEVLSEFGVDHFHAVDCAHGVRQFKRLSPAQRNELLTRLIGIIKRRMEIGIAVSVSETDFGKCVPPRWIRGGPYVICAAQVLSGVVGWADKRNFSGKISYYFEKGHRHRGLTNNTINQLLTSATGYDGLRYETHDFGEKRSMMPLQAADILAYEWIKELKRLNCPPIKRSMRKSLESLLDQTHVSQHFDAKTLYSALVHGHASVIEHMRRFEEVE
jgi:hypothetical protein